MILPVIRKNSLLLCLLLLVVVSSTGQSAEVLHHWRFEEGSDYLNDSVGGVVLTVPPNDRIGSPVTSYPVPNDNRGRYFPSSFRSLGANSGAVDFKRASRRGLVGQESTELDGDLTIEMFTHIDRLSGVGLAANLASQLTEALDTAGHGWAFKIRMSGSNTIPHELAFANSDGSSWHTPASGILIDERTDYYLAGSFDLEGKEATYYAYDLERNSLQITTVPHSMTSLNPDPTMVIGDADCSCAVDGLIDEVRLSRGVVPFEELLIHDAEFGPGRTMFESISVGPKELYSATERSNGTVRVSDVRMRSEVSLNDSNRQIAKFLLPSIDEATLLDEAKLRVFVTRTPRPDDAELSLWHSLTDNDFERQPEDFDDPSYVDSKRNALRTNELTEQYFEVDVTDLVRSDFQLDPDVPVSSFRMQSSAESRFFVSALSDALRRPQLVLSFRSTTEGDFDGNGVLDIADLDLLTASVGMDETTFDLNSDGSVDGNDLLVWIHDLRGTWVGDSDLDGEFGSSDLTSVFQAGMYESDQQATWAQGDWTGEGRFDSADLVAAFVDGGYEQGPRPAGQAVPEPSSSWLLMFGWLGITLHGVYQRRRLNQKPTKAF